jgi:hypothetical protein
MGDFPKKYLLLPSFILTNFLFRRGCNYVLENKTNRRSCLAIFESTHFCYKTTGNLESKPFLVCVSNSTPRTLLAD